MLGLSRTLTPRVARAVEESPGKPVDFGKITEAVERSWYDYPSGVTHLHPSVGVAELNARKDNAYSFVKAPRYNGQPMEVGPLARGLVNRYPELMEPGMELSPRLRTAAGRAARLIKNSV